jgi:CubicO group peptidase (beta-lactamase class C family)
VSNYTKASMHKMKKYYFYFPLMFFGLLAPAQQTISMNSFMQYCNVNLRFNGVVLVADSNKILYKRAFGKAEKKTGENNELTTKFRLGSMSKQFTAFVALQLIEQRKLSFNDRLAKHIAAFNQPDKQNITIRNLLTHTSGLADYTNLRNFNDQIYYNQDSIIKMIAVAPLSFPSSSDYRYSNSNFYLLALIIEKLTGKSFDAVLNEVVLHKAAMLNSGEEIGKVVPHEATAYLYNNDSATEAPFIEMKNTKGGGGMYSTGEDLLKWSLFFQYRLAKDTVFKNALQPFILPDGTKTMYSLGGCLMPDVIFHTGHINGFANLIAIDTTHHLTIILLTNDDYRQLYVTMQSLYNIFLNNTTFTNWLNNKPGNNLAEYKGIYSIGDLKVNIKDTTNYLEAEAFGQKQFLRWYQNDEFFFLNMEGIVKFERNTRGGVFALKSFQDYNWVTLKKE